MSNVNTDWKVDLGVQVEDNITGFKGIVTGRVEYVTGCLQYLLTPKVDDEGKRQASEWFDEDRLLKPEPDPEPESIERIQENWPPITRGGDVLPVLQETPYLQTTPTTASGDWGPERDDER